jgi:3-isopropylmalate/(R)-2-methylmalate dehydratase small subunit
MSALVKLEGRAAPLLEPDVNTDSIAPLYREPGGGAAKAGERTQAELSRNLFANRRFTSDGTETDFVLNQPPFRDAKFLIGGPNFACGSSRETAATMLSAFGIRCVIAPSFASIFFDNCFRNYMLPLALDEPTVQRLGRLAATGATFALDVERGLLIPPEGTAIPFTLPAFRRELLLTGADEISVTLKRAQQIASYEAHAIAQRPWEMQAG